MHRTPELILLVLALSACQADSISLTEGTVRDSAGVRIVEYPAMPEPTHTFDFSPEPIYRFGDDEDEYLFQRILHGALQPDGGAVIADGGTREVLLLAPDGSFRGILARRGSGPDEIASIGSVHVLGQDTVLVEDDGNAKFMIFENGVLERSTTVPADFSLTFALGVQGLDSIGRLLMTTTAYLTEFDEPWLSGHMVRYDLASETVDTVAPYDLARRSHGDQPTNAFPPFGVTSVTGGQFVYGRSDIPEIHWLGPGGDLRQILRWAPQRVHPTEDDLVVLSERLRSALPRMNPGMAPERVEQLVQDQMSRYTVAGDEPLPLFSIFESDGQGGLWVGEHVIGPAEVQRYVVVASDGTWRGSVDLPPRFRILDVNERLVLGILADELDVESVAAFRVSELPID